MLGAGAGARVGLWARCGGGVRCGGCQFGSPRGSRVCAEVRPLIRQNGRGASVPALWRAEGCLWITVSTAVACLSVKRMPRTSRWIAAALSLAVIASLSACVTEPEPSPRTSSATPAPDSVFDSDADALAAAIDAYEAYVTMNDRIGAEGGENAERIRPFVTATYAESLISEFDGLRERSLRTSGSTKFDSTRLQSRSQSESGEQLKVYLCLDVTDVRINDVSGGDKTPPDRKVKLPLEISMVSSGDEADRLLVGGSEPWSGDDFC